MCVGRWIWLPAGALWARPAICGALDRASVNSDAANQRSPNDVDPFYREVPEPQERHTQEGERQIGTDPIGADHALIPASSSASPPKPPSKSSRNAPHPTTRKRPRETLRPFAPRTQTFGVSGCRRCLRRVANARKFQDYSGERGNYKYAAI